MKSTPSRSAAVLEGVEARSGVAFGLRVPDHRLFLGGADCPHYGGPKAFSIIHENTMVLAIKPSGLVHIPNDLMVRQVRADQVLASNLPITSSRRYKSEIAPVQGALEAVQRLQGVSYRSRRGTTEVGRIAEEVVEVVPEVVTTDPVDGQPAAVDYCRLVAVLVEAVKAQQHKLDEVRAELSVIRTHAA